MNTNSAFAIFHSAVALRYLYCPVIQALLGVDAASMAREAARTLLHWIPHCVVAQWFVTHPSQRCSCPLRPLVDPHSHYHFPEHNPDM